MVRQSTKRLTMVASRPSEALQRRQHTSTAFSSILALATAFTHGLPFRYVELRQPRAPTPVVTPHRLRPGHNCQTPEGAPVSEHGSSFTSQYVLNPRVPSTARCVTRPRNAGLPISPKGLHAAGGHPDLPLSISRTCSSTRLSFVLYCTYYIVPLPPQLTDVHPPCRAPRLWYLRSTATPIQQRLQPKPVT